MASLSLKKAIQGLLRRLGIYQRVKSSCLYDLYWKIADPKLIQDRSRELEFYRTTLQGLRRGDVVFDIGANVGQKTDIFLRLGTRVVAVDPDESNQAVLRQRFLTYRLRAKPVVVVGQAISDKNGTETMWLDEPGSAKNTLNSKWVDTLKTDSTRFGKALDFAEQRKVETITLTELMQRHGSPFYVKIDVEGHEPAVLRGLDRPVPYVSFEVNLPEFRAEALQCIESLQRLASAGEFNYAADCRRGLALGQWLPMEAFCKVVNACQEACIEVFWRTPAAGRTVQGMNSPAPH